MSKTIIVAGGAGFIPSHVCRHLVDSGNKVFCIDNVSTGSKKNIESLLESKNFEFIEADIRNRSFFDRFSSIQINEIYHLASPASVDYIMEHPIEAATVNSLGTLNLLELARKKGAKILFASSSEVYGEAHEHPQKESYWGNVNPVGVRSGYDEGKRFGEALCMAYYRETGVNVKIVRIFNTYGPASSVTDSRVVPKFVTSALVNKPIPVHGDGSQTRSLCYVSDLVEGIIKTMESDVVGPINLGNPYEIKIIDLAKKIIEKTRSSSKISFVERPEDDPSKRKPDITLAEKTLHWKPRVELDEGLNLTISYFKKALKLSP